ncbi:MAG: hypothetical protein HY874_11040, partial [Chloroflexi bacterium]|nr:hypothetical protein [Chloroflexota bacterium]
MRWLDRGAWLLLAGPFLALETPALSAQEPAPAPKAAPQASDARWLVAAREMELEELVSGAATALDLAIDFNPVELAGAVTVRLPVKPSGEELWDVASQALASRGLTSVQAAGSAFLKIAAIVKACGRARLEEGGLG